MSLILGIETSCDETATAIVQNGSKVLGASVASQIKKHAEFGGVVPELAAREHLKAVKPLLDDTLKQANVSLQDLDAIAVTQGPGLMPALLVGVNWAKGLSIGNDIPIIGINHFLAHIYACFLDGQEKQLSNPSTYPILALVVSGGHTALMLINEKGEARLVGTTIDDAAGEALDKAAKMLDLGYPGGPVIQKTAANGDSKRYKFPRPLTGSSGKAVPEEHKYNFSFSGIKTALLYHLQNYEKNNGSLKPQDLYDTAASYQEAIVDVLCKKTALAAQDFGAKTVVMCGGVACNAVLREQMREVLPQGCQLQLAAPKYCTDNAAMVAGIAHFYFEDEDFSNFSMDAFARLPVIAKVPFVKVEFG